jgi:YD repeat-containing protein
LLTGFAGFFALWASGGSAQTTTYTYDSLGRLTNSSVSTGASTVYTLDAADNRSRLTNYTGSGPHAVNDSASTTAVNPVTVSVLANDTSPSSYSLTISSATNGAHGTTAVNSGTTVTYTPASTFAGTDAFNYTISDGHGGTATATASVLVPGNPVANADELYLEYTAYNTTDTFAPAGNLDPTANDTSYLSYPLTVTAVTQGAKGSVSHSGNTVYYSYHNTSVLAEFHDTDTFTYTVSDGHGGTATTTVYVNVDVVGNW